MTQKILAIVGRLWLSAAIIVGVVKMAGFTASATAWAIHQWVR